MPPLGAVEDLPEGGFGWHVIRTLSKDLHYRRENGRNQLSFRLDTTQSGELRRFCLYLAHTCHANAKLRPQIRPQATADTGPVAA